MYVKNFGAVLILLLPALLDQKETSNAGRAIHVTSVGRMLHLGSPRGDWFKYRPGQFTFPSLYKICQSAA